MIAAAKRSQHAEALEMAFEILSRGKNNIAIKRMEYEFKLKLCLSDKSIDDASLLPLAESLKKILLNAHSLPRAVNSLGNIRLIMRILIQFLPL